MLNQSEHPATFPLRSLERAVKQRESYILGLYGVHSTKCHNARAAKSSLSTGSFLWGLSLNRLLDSIICHGDRAPVLISFDELAQNYHSHSNAKSRYSDAETIARWRSVPLCVLDLGCDNHQQIRRFGRQCDGVAMIVLGELKAAKKQLKRLSHDAIPWIGYWTVAFNAHTAETSLYESVRSAA